jgi:hypothetical protein
MIYKPVAVRGGPACAMRYLFAPEDAAGRSRPQAPVLIDGCVELFVAAAEASHLRSPYFAFVVSYQESLELVGRARVAADYLSWVQRITGGMCPSRLPRAGVLHVTATGCHVHGCVATQDLLTGRQVPLWTGTVAEWAETRTAVRVRNLREGYSDPSEVREWRAREPELREQINTVAASFRVRTTEELSALLRVGALHVYEYTHDHIAVETVSGHRYKFPVGSAPDGARSRISIARAEEPARREHCRRDPLRAACEIADGELALGELAAKRTAEFARRFGAESLVTDGAVHGQLLSAFVADDASGVAHGLRLRGDRCRRRAGRDAAAAAAVSAVPLVGDSGDAARSESAYAGAGTDSREAAARCGEDGAARPRVGGAGAVVSIQRQEVVDRSGTDSGSGALPPPGAAAGDNLGSAVGTAATGEPLILPADPYGRNDQPPAIVAAYRQRCSRRARLARALLRGIGAALSSAFPAAEREGDRGQGAVALAVGLVSAVRAVAAGIDRANEARRAEPRGVRCASFAAGASCAAVDAHCAELGRALGRSDLEPPPPRLRPLPVPSSRPQEVQHGW